MTRSDTTLLLEAVRAGDPGAHDELLRVVYTELRAMAAIRMRGERGDHTLQATALANEAWMRLVDGPTTWESRAHFFGAASEAMRRILVDYARERQAQKRGGKRRRVTLSELVAGVEDSDIDILALEQALVALEREQPRLRRVVEMRFFVGMTVDDVAETLHVSKATVKRDWSYARAWLYDFMSRTPEP